MVETWTGSYSKLALFEKCPRAYFYKYIQGLEYSTPALELGKRIHEGIARFITTGEETAEIADFLTGKVYALKGTPQEFVERPIRFSVDGIQMDGVIDVVANGQIIDWKTNWVKNSDPRQLLLYTHGARQEGLDVEKALFHYLRYAEDVEIDLQEENIQKTLDWTKQMLENIAECQFDYDLSEDIEVFPKTSDFGVCLKCPYKSLCNSVSTAEDVIKLAKEIEELENLLELKKEMLRDYIEEFGEVNTGTSVWKLTVVNNWDFDTRKVYDYIQSLGKDPLQFLNCTLTNLKKLKITEQELEHLGTKRVTYRLTKTKNKEAR
ncbi:PD-(D/E)XK nuclease family protein [Caldicellulosiruptor acetigenus]|uniref:RecB family exonuclease n=1 Tax=Caldicellulosiruptor acetigenus TaxID=301953 RepID=UPI0022A949A9|nr:PD-(D/E)XK nuclease family protein [Caldicellulosiruptor acetigenus]WAM36640.1 PD-(D/E)XK nuclease family protein [Caldicellulosiruptor acetigenus]